MENLIVYGLIGGLVVLALLFLDRQAARPIKKQADGSYHLRVSKLYAVIGYGGLLMGSLFLIFLLLEDALGAAEGLLIVVFSLLFMGTGIYLLLWQLNHRLTANGQELRVTDWRNREKKLAWQDIEQLKFNALAGSYVFFGKERARLTISQHLVGLSTLLQQVERQTGLRIAARTKR